MRDYTKIPDFSKLPDSQQPNIERNMLIAKLFLEGKRSVEIAQIIYQKYGDLLSNSRIYELKNIWEPYVKAQAEKGDKHE